MQWLACRAGALRRLAADDVVREFFDELRHERVERFRIFAMREMITFQRTGDLCFIDQRLIVGGGLFALAKLGMAIAAKSLNGEL